MFGTVKCNTARLLCLKMSQHAPLPVLETHITPWRLTDWWQCQSSCGQQMLNCGCGASLMIRMRHVRLKRRVIRWDSRSDCMLLSMLDSFVYISPSLFVTGEAWSEARTWFLFCNRLLGTGWNFFFFWFLFYYHALQTNGISVLQISFSCEQNTWPVSLH